MTTSTRIVLAIASIACLGGVLYTTCTLLPIVAPTPKTTAKQSAIPNLDKKATPRTLIVKNNIEKKMTGYRKMGKTWCADDYNLTVNGTLINTLEQETISCPEGTCKLVFWYDFRPMGYSYKSGTEELTYEVPRDAKEIEVTFSWYERPQIIVTAKSTPPTLKS